MRFLLMMALAAGTFGVIKTWDTQESQDLRAWASQTILGSETSKKTFGRVRESFTDQVLSREAQSTRTAPISSSHRLRSSSTPNVASQRPLVQREPTQRRRLLRRRPGILLPAHRR